MHSYDSALHEKSPNTEFILVCTFSVFGLNIEIYTLNLSI